MVSSAVFSEMCDRPLACPRPVSRFWVGVGDGDGDVFSVWLTELLHLENETNRGQGTQLFSHTGPKKIQNRFLFQTLTFLRTFFLLNYSNGRVCWKYCEWMLGSLALWLLQGCSNSLFTLCRNYHNYEILL